MNDDHEQPTTVGKESNQDSSVADSRSSDKNPRYAALVLRNNLVDEDTLHQAMEVATADG